MTVERTSGVPRYDCEEFAAKTSEYCLLIPIINEGERIVRELTRAQNAGVDKLVDVVICDGGSTDGCTEQTRLKSLGVNTLLTKRDAGKQGAQLRMGIAWALARGYQASSRSTATTRTASRTCRSSSPNCARGSTSCRGLALFPAARRSTRRSCATCRCVSSTRPSSR